MLTPDAETWTHMQKEIEVQMNPDNGEVTIHHRITNMGAWPVMFAPWALSVMAAGGKAIIPQAKRETLTLPNRVLALWPESQMNDHRVYWGERYILLQQDETAKPLNSERIMKRAGLPISTRAIYSSKLTITTCMRFIRIMAFRLNAIRITFSGTRNAR